MNIRKIAAWICICALALVGCSNIAGENAAQKELNELTGKIQDTKKHIEGENAKETIPLSFGLTPEFTYAVIPMKVAIKVNQLGYQPRWQKIAVFEGIQSPQNFQVVEYQTGQVVFEGQMQSNLKTNDGETFLYGDFSDLTEIGTFCVRTDEIGYSYPFQIGENLYGDLLQEATKQFYYSRCGTSLTEEFAKEGARNACHTSFAKMQEDMKIEVDVTGGWHTDEKGNRSVLTSCNAMQTLLLSSELYGSVFLDDSQIPEQGDSIPDLLNELQYEAAWLLKMQDGSTGGVYDGVRTTDYGNGNVYSYVQASSVATSLKYAATMAKFSYVYQNYDNAFATTCLRAADRALRYAKHYPDDLDENLLFQAAVELYRATGYLNYRNDLDTYLIKHDHFDVSNEVVFQACVTYLLSKQKVNTSYCEIMIGDLMNYVEDISYVSRNAIYLSTDQQDGEKSLTDMLRDTARISVVNYVITNNEYDRLLLNYTHYFLGCNEDALCYVGNHGSHNASELTANGIMKHAESAAYWILLLSSIQTWMTL